MNNINIRNKINEELNLIGINPYLIGRTYIFDAIMYLLQNSNNSQKVYIYLSKKYKKIEELEEKYIAKYSYERGVPLPTEFLYYYVEKIKKELFK